MPKKGTVRRHSRSAGTKPVTGKPGPGKAGRDILCIPGLGGDARLFEPILKYVDPEVRKRVKYVLLTPPREKESLAVYTARILGEQNIAGKAFSLVVGISFGGAIAQEALKAGAIRSGRALLVSTAYSGANTTTLTRACAKILQAFPVVAHRPIVDSLAAVYPLIRRMKEAKLFAAMFREQPPAMIFRVPAMIAGWRPESPGVLPCSFVLVQGTRDPLFSFTSLNRTRAVDVPIARGNHLVCVTDAERIASLF